MQRNSLPSKTPTLLIGAIIFLVSFAQKTYAQTVRFQPDTLQILDSLNTLIQNPETSDQKKVDVYLESTKYLMMKRPDSTLQICEKALEISQRINYADGILGSQLILAPLYTKMENYDKAVQYFRATIEFTETIPALNSLTATYSRALANIYYEQTLTYDTLSEAQALINNKTEAATYYIKAAELFQTLNNTEESAICYKKAGKSYRKVKMASESKENFLKAGKLYGKAGNKKGEASSLNLAAIQCESLGETEEAITLYEQAFSGFKSVKDTSLQIIVLKNMAELHSSEGQFAPANAAYKKALRLSELTKDLKQQASVWQNIGLNYVNNANQGEDALDAYEHALSFYDSTGNDKGMSDVHNQIGIFHFYRGNYPEAYEHYDKALKINQRIKFEAGIAASLSNQGTVLRRWGKTKEALEKLMQALEIRQKLNDVSSLGNINHSIGVSYVESGQHVTGLRYFLKGLEYRELNGDKREISNSLRNIGLVYYQFNDLDSAEYYYQKALEISNSINDERGKSYVLSSLALVKERSGDFETSLTLQKESLKIREALHDKSGQATALHNMAATWRKLGDIDKALELYHSAMELNKELKDKLAIANTCNSLGSVYSNMENQRELALDYYVKALTIRKEIGKKDGIGSSLNNIGLFYKKQGELDKALSYYQQALDTASKYQVNDLKATTLNNIGSYYSHKGDFSKAIDYYQQALNIRKESGLFTSELINLGQAYKDIGQIDKAEEYLTQALEQATASKVLESKATVLNNLGGLYNQKGESDKAYRFLKKAYKLYDKIDNPAGKASCLINMATSISNSGNFTEALVMQQEALRLATSVQKISSMVTANINIAYLQGELGNTDEESEYLQTALKLCLKSGDLASLTTIYNNLGSMYSNQGDIARSVNYYEKALNIADSIGLKSSYANTCNNLGSLFEDQGNEDKAEKYYLKSLKIATEIQEDELISTCYNNLGGLYGMNGEYDKALDYYQKSAKIDQDAGDEMSYASSLSNMANIYAIKNKKRKGLKTMKKALRIYSKGGNEIQKIILSINLGYYYLNNGKLGKARKITTEALENSIKSKQQKELLLAKGQMRNVSIADDQLTSADSFAIDETNILNQMILSNFSVLSESSQEKFMKTVRSDYMEFNSYALWRKDANPKITEQVLNNTIKNKGLLLKSSVAMRNAILNSGDSTLILNYQKWISLRKQITRLTGTDTRTDSLVALANETEKELVRNSRDFSDFNEIQNLSWKDVQKSLKPGEAAIEFIHFRWKNLANKQFVKFSDSTLYCALIITPECTSPIMVQLFEEKELEKILGKFGGNNLKYINEIYGKRHEVQTQLYNTIWKPLEKHLKGIKTIYLSPDGLLHKVSFAAIAKDKKTYLSDAYQLNMKSSTGKLINARNQELHALDLPNATLFGGIKYNTDSTTHQVWSYLPGTKKETSRIDEILKEKHVPEALYLSASATETAFKNQAGSSKILHIATHGFFYPDPKEVKKDMEKESMLVEDIEFRGGTRAFGVASFVENTNPMMRSGLVFAGANDVWTNYYDEHKDDGVLTALEVSHLDLRNTEIVVLSACETGLGDIKGSEGVYGLQRAFKMAGSHYIIMSLWQVPDKETMEFMTMFYEELLQSKNVQSAFSATQTNMRKQYDPYFWAAFVLFE